MLRRTPFVHKLLSRLDKLNPQEIRNHFEDLSSRQAHADEILDAIEEGVLLFVPRQNLIYANRNAKLWILDQGRAPSEMKPIEDLIADSRLKAWVSSETKDLRSKVIRSFEILSPRERKIKAALIPLDPDAHHSRVLMLLSPLEAEKASESKRVFEHLESLVRLSAGIAHEIGNPLNSIAIHLELLKKQAEALPEVKRRSFEKSLSVLKAETARLDGIVRNFLKATRKPPLRFKLENLNEILEDALEFMMPELRQAKIKVEFFQDESLPLCLVDRERLHQAFMNLIKNAMEACQEKGKGRLEIRITHRSKAVWLEFKDNGVGIPEADLPHIFEAYFTTKKEGSGLGLMTVYTHVREHGGRIEVESTPGKETLFTLILPMRQPKLQIPEMKSK